MSLIFLVIVSVITLSAIWYNRRKKLMNKLKRYGIPGPTPHLIYGNFKEYQTKGYAKCHEEWIQKYGRIVGYYLGAKPFVLIADPELLKIIQIKEFNQFSKRKLLLDGGLNINPRLKNSLIACEDSRWREMRSTLSPTFSGAKLKQMTPIIESAIDQFVNRVEEHKKLDKEIDIYDLAQDLTMDTIAKSGFGFDSGAQTETERQVINAAKKSFQVQVSQFFLFISFLFPEFLWVINPFRLVAEMISDYLGQSSRGFLLKVSDQLIKQRREQKGDKQKDLLQMMIESEGTDILSNDKLSVSSDMNNDTVVDSNVRINKKTKMTDDEIAANSVLFFEAGYETTSTALGYLMHILINKPEIQEKCRQEVKQLLESEGRLDYNTVTKLKYMESVIYETLRIYPPITTFISRMPKTDYPYNGLTLPKGVDLRVPLYFLQKDPELWSEPEEFIPERFSDENKHLINPVVWQPFGTGPRNCIGMRFALLEMKLSMAKLLNQYAFIPSPNTELGDIQRDFKVISMTPKNGVFTKAVDISS